MSTAYSVRERFEDSPKTPEIQDMGSYRDSEKAQLELNNQADSIQTFQKATNMFQKYTVSCGFVQIVDL